MTTTIPDPPYRPNVIMDSEVEHLPHKDPVGREMLGNHHTNISLAGHLVIGAAAAVML